jgi:hypothetical protein
VTDSYLLFLYPFLLDVPGYRVRATNLPDAERDRNLEMLRYISEQTVAHGLDFQLGIWMHGYELIKSPDARYVIEGLTPDTHAAYLGLLRFQDDGPFVAPPRALRVLQGVKYCPKAHQRRCPFVKIDAPLQELFGLFELPLALQVDAEMKVRRRIVWKARNRLTEESFTILDNPAPEIHPAKSCQRFSARLDTHDLAPAFLGLGEPASTFQFVGFVPQVSAAGRRHPLHRRLRSCFAR